MILQMPVYGYKNSIEVTLTKKLMAEIENAAEMVKHLRMNDNDMSITIPIKGKTASSAIYPSLRKGTIKSVHYGMLWITVSAGHPRARMFMFAVNMHMSSCTVSVATLAKRFKEGPKEGKIML